MEQKNNKKKLYVIIAILGAILVISGTSYAILTLVLQGTAENVLRTGNLALTLTEGNSINLTASIPISDEEGLLGDAFSFTLENEGSIPSGYTIYVDDQPLEAGENRVPGTDLRYELKVNGTRDKLANLDNDTTTIYTGNISANSTINFELRLWIDYDVTSLPSNGVHRSSIRIEATQGTINDTSNANAPVLSSDLIPVTYEADGTVLKADINSEWYNYDDKMWANAVEVSETTKATYTSASSGTEILMSDIEQMFVWIPRYSYDPASIVQASEAIDVTFVSQNVPAHPAFTFGTDELEGLWIGKFEMGFKTGEDETTSNVSYVIKPNLNSVHSSDVSTMYDKINNITITNGDVHMIKNTEWGLVTYLSQSKYGVCNNDGTCTSKVANNAYYIESSGDATTGCGPVMNGNTVTDDASTTACPDTSKWNTSIGQEASTTNNIYGIFDMAGGRHENVIGFMENPSNILEWDLNNFTTAPEEKYYDRYEYTKEGTNYDAGLKGDATRELNPLLTETQYEEGSVLRMSHWNDDGAIFSWLHFRWFYRGGRAGNTTGSGIYYFASTKDNIGVGSIYNSSRASLAIPSP